MNNSPILVLGAYGLAGSGIIHELLRSTELSIIASGRDETRLNGIAEVDTARIETVQLDATNDKELRSLCTRAAIVVNAVGPYGKDGARIAEAVIGCGCSYVDCASEQIHFECLRALSGEAVAPCETAVGAAFHDDGAAAVALWIDADHGFVVFEEDGCGVSEVLALLPIDDDLAIRVTGEIDDGYGITAGHVLGGDPKAAENCR